MKSRFDLYKAEDDWLPCCYGGWSDMNFMGVNTEVKSITESVMNGETDLSSVLYSIQDLQRRDYICSERLNGSVFISDWASSIYRFVGNF